FKPNWWRLGKSSGVFANGSRELISDG
ncbi:regulatory protein luxO, partial [Vibrio parahaemolyticus VPTS-2010]